MAATFVAVTAAWFYLAPSTGDAAALIFIVAFALIDAATGFLIGRWWAALLPAANVLVLVPHPSSGDIPTWFLYLLFVSWPSAIVIALGVGARRVASRR